MYVPLKIETYFEYNHKVEAYFGYIHSSRIGERRTSQRQKQMQVKENFYRNSECHSVVERRIGEVCHQYNIDVKISIPVTLSYSKRVTTCIILPEKN